ncbi:MAG: YeiH family putative sulfate export transporter [Xanthobacteraceae bacterium]|nr:YeiH family putative sulfate export transporter [Xanthobacteraceae bacterium]MBX3533455.1 YeiH family putative sulfate export transporter [Xanthobacteraceae bacterium]MCW5676395.1 YeiH family putative sulfate export transporter [Xanthobacteraceae bacterium]
MSSEKNAPSTIVGRLIRLLPGVLLSAGIALLGVYLERLELQMLAFPYIGALVLAILIGMMIRTFWTPSEVWQTGIRFSAKQLLEVAVTLLGASISFATIAASGTPLIAAIVATVIVSLSFTYFLSRMFGLSKNLSILVACGNSICGNSAIATVAPVIKAAPEDVASSISFTAILGVLIVVGLPLLITAMNLSATQFGILAGLTVYAVPQVLATTIPAGLASVQIGTLVKLIRVLMLAPIVMTLSVISSDRSSTGEQRSGIRYFALVPWFIVGFLVLASIRSFGLFPEVVVTAFTKVAVFLTIISMAALGLGVDLRLLARVGGRVTAAVTLSLVLLVLMSLVTVQFFK